MAASDSFYNELLVDVNATIDEFGTTYSVRLNGSYDSATLTTTPGSSRSVSGIVSNQQVTSAVASILFPVTERSSNWIGKKTLLLKADSAPQSGEEILVDGNWFPLSKVISIKPADIVVLYILDVTR